MKPSADTEDTGKESGIRGVSIGRSIGRRTGRNGGIIIMVGFISVVALQFFEVADLEFLNSPYLVIDSYRL